MTYKVSTRQLTEVVLPVCEPVSLPEMKAHLREDYSDNDTIITAQIIAARQWVENYCQRALVQRTYRADIPCFSTIIELPMMPLSSITNIKYYNTDSPQVLTTLDSAVYGANTSYNYIYLADGQTLPGTAYRHDAVQITFVAGYEPSTDSPQDWAGNVPQALRAALKLQVGDLFENREINSQLKMTELPTVTNLLSAYRNL